MTRTDHPAEKTIISDFDQTIAISDWPDIHGLVPGARRYLTQLKRDGYTIVVSSGRANKTHNNGIGRALGIKLMTDFLDQQHVPHDRVDFGHEGKMIGAHYIDDKGVGSPTKLWRGKRVVDWPRAYRMIRAKDRADGRR